MHRLVSQEIRISLEVHFRSSIAVCLVRQWTHVQASVHGYGVVPHVSGGLSGTAWFDSGFMLLDSSGAFP